MFIQADSQLMTAYFINLFPFSLFILIPGRDIDYAVDDDSAELTRRVACWNQGTHTNTVIKRILLVTVQL
jgi:hypothetical protein